ncbi:MAG TPA: GAF domain-containing protein [Burkholderiales bacterium]|nr:GAF domain-containing protein [Burkholderiales bacterium]
MDETALQRAHTRTTEMIGEGRTLREILSYLVGEAESISGTDAVCSVLLLDKEGLLRNGASPGLPADYLDAIDRLKPDAAVGTCAAAAATGKVVITPDLLSDAGWKELRHLPLALGLTAAWSVPIVGADGRVLGTFGTYFRQARRPRPDERSFVEAMAQLARTVIEGAAQARPAPIA